jgi:hypothetical protein
MKKLTTILVLSSLLLTQVSGVATAQTATPAAQPASKPAPAPVKVTLTQDQIRTSTSGGKSVETVIPSPKTVLRDPQRRALEHPVFHRQRQDLRGLAPEDRNCHRERQERYQEDSGPHHRVHQRPLDHCSTGPQRVAEAQLPGQDQLSPHRSSRPRNFSCVLHLPQTLLVPIRRLSVHSRPDPARPLLRRNA